LFGTFVGYRRSVLIDRIEELLASDPQRCDLTLRIETDGRDERDELLGLLRLHDLWVAPIEHIGAQARWQAHPAAVAAKWELETRFESRLDAVSGHSALPDDTSAAMRTLAARDRVPKVYTWLAETATWPEFVDFLAIEGGPDGGFDDLVAICQVGLDGQAKMVLADNYWDEMGRGDLEAVHTTLHRELAAAVEMPVVARDELPLPALRRSALNGLLASNRRLQPEMLGALGLLELQAGPRCRHVLRGLRRLGGPPAAVPFYEVHEHVDPHHGKVWLDDAVGPIVAQFPEWGPQIVRGAAWRSAVNHALFDHLLGQFATAQLAA
jgi:hypothetical protein